MTKTDRNKKYSEINDTAQKYSKKGVNYNKTVLPNGLRIVSEEVTTVESFALGLFIKAGSRNDENGLWGTAHFVEHATFRQTRNYNFKQLAAKFESMGAYFNAYTTKEATCFFVRALKEHFPVTLELLSEIAFNPVFSEKDAEKERKIILEEVKSCEDDLEELSFDFADRILFGKHSIAYPIIGLQKSVKDIKLENVIDFHNKYYTHSNCVIALAGDVSHSMLVDTISTIEALNRNPDHSKDLQTSVQIVQEKKVNQLKRSTQQAHILLSKRVDGLESDDRYPLNVLSIIFGDGMSSRLNQQLREKHGLAYSAYSSLQLYSDCGGFYIYSAGEANKVEKILSIIDEEMTKLKTKNITVAEMKRAKEQLKTSVILDMESMSARMEALAKGELLNNEYEDVPSTIQAIEAVNESIIISMIEKYMQFDDWSKILILPK